MNSRSILITVVIAPVIVGIILLLVEYSFFSIEGTIGRSLEKQAKEAVQALNESENINDEIYIEPDIDDLKVLFQIASNIYGSGERNIEYLKLIEVALSESKPGFSFAIAKNIYGSDDRNYQYVKIIDKSIETERFGLALAITSNIYGSDKRNKEYKKILAAGIIKRKKTLSKDNQSITPVADTSSVVTN